jgi:molecular chaperone DnaK
MAKRSAAMFPDDCVQFEKRYMGDQHWSHIDSAAVTRRAEEVSALILRRVVDDAQMMTGEKFAEAVITVPAYFDDARRQATKDAAALAGLSVLRLLNEPTAAAIAYGMDHGDAGTILVYDLGGGTFDVTLLRRDGDELIAVATDGDRNLGGFDFDNLLMELVAKKVADDGGPELFDGGAVQANLRERCELAKRTLSNVTKATVYVSVDGRNFSVPISRAEFDQAAESLLFRTEVCVESVLEVEAERPPYPRHGRLRHPCALRHLPGRPVRPIRPVRARAGCGSRVLSVAAVPRGSAVVAVRVTACAPGWAG